MESAFRIRLTLSLGVVLVLSSLGCQLSPQAKEAQFLARAKKEVAQKDYSRAILNLKNAARAMPKDVNVFAS